MTSAPSESSVDCSLIHSSPIHPRGCCEYPFVMLNDSTVTTCFNECPFIKRKKEYANKTEQEIDRCCHMRCVYKVSGILTSDDMLSPDALKASFGKHKVPVLTDEWLGIIDKAVEACVPLCELSHQFCSIFNLFNFLFFLVVQSSKHLDGECLPEYFSNILVCTFNHIFLHCAGFKSSEQGCKNLKTTVKNCQGKGELSIIDWDLFYFYKF